MDKIKVSIICNAYNHEKYIRDALDGFIMQKTNFPFEVLVHDDASTDRTADIIREYEAKYPEIIKPIYETENQYSKNDGSLERIQYGRVRGKYIAVCEGDDYWTDQYKLQKQYDALEENPQLDICSHYASLIDSKTNAKWGIVPEKKQNRIIATGDVIKGGGGFVATNSLMYRASLFVDPPEFTTIILFDYTIQIYGALRGGMLFIPEDMSVYRTNSEGSWTEHMRNNPEERLKHRELVKKMLCSFDEYTNNKHHEAIDYIFKKMEYNRLSAAGQYKEMMSKKYAVIRKNQSLKARIKFFCKYLFSPKLEHRKNGIGN